MCDKSMCIIQLYDHVSPLVCFVLHLSLRMMDSTSWIYTSSLMNNHQRPFTCGFSVGSCLTDFPSLNYKAIIASSLFLLSNPFYSMTYPSTFVCIDLHFPILFQLNSSALHFYSQF